MLCHAQNIIIGINVSFLINLRLNSDWSSVNVEQILIVFLCGVFVFLVTFFKKRDGLNIESGIFFSKLIIT